MALTTGARLGPYEIVAAIGAGGMGEVYRALDTRLDRDVAIKIVPELFAADHERLTRFEREAKTLASLNHPNIAQIHGIEGGDIVRALVMEFVDGEDLAQRIARGPISLDEALEIARQIADALEAAHERGVIHRDLKPANIKVRNDGTVKVLDFGLSKAMDPRVSTSDLAQSPTFTSPSTQLGVILGTAAYMAPEQAKGKIVDKRGDIWSFGVVLFEMLAGRSPFGGETVTDVLAHIVSRDPDWTLLPPQTPPQVLHLLKRCLERDPKRRLRDIGDARFELERPPASAGSAVTPTGRRIVLLGGIAAAALLAVGMVAGWMIGRSDRQPPQPVRRFGLSRLSLVVDPWQSIAVSPDGRHLVYRGFGDDGIDRLFIRTLDRMDTRAIPGSDGGRLPFFSTDSTQLAFFSTGHLRRSDLVGGSSAQALVPLKGVPLGGTWMDDGSIVYVDSIVGLIRLRRGATTPEVVRSVDTGDSVTPWGLPGSRGVLLAVRVGTQSQISALSLGDGSLRTLVQDGWAPAWSPAGGLLYSQGESIFRAPFDVDRLRLTGSPEPVVTGARNRVSVQARLFGVANDGTLAYMPASIPGLNMWSMVWVDRSGRESLISDVGALFDSPRLSPDGTRVAFRKPAPNCDVWSYDLTRGTSTRLTLEGDNHGVVWSADGKRLLFARRGEVPQLLSVPAAGGPVHPVGDQSRLSFLGRQDVHLSAFGARGDFLVRLAADTYVFGESREPRLLGQPAFEDSQAAFSPDGGHLAYVSDESGRMEVYLQDYPGGTRRIQVSTEGGTEPVWARSGKELFFRQGLRVFAVDVSSASDLALGRPRLLFTGNYMTSPISANYDVSPDGKRFLMVKGPAVGGRDEIIVQLGGFEGKF